MKAKDLPADLIREWALRQTKASAKLEGRELPKDYVRPEKVQRFLDLYAPDESLGLRPVRNFNGEIVTYVDD